MSDEREREIKLLRERADVADWSSTFALCPAQAADCKRRAFDLRSQADALAADRAIYAEMSAPNRHAPGCALLDPAAEPPVCDCGRAQR